MQQAVAFLIGIRFVSDNIRTGVSVTDGEYASDILVRHITPPFEPIRATEECKCEGKCTRTCCDQQSFTQNR